MSNQNLAEEYLDFVEGPIWASIVSRIRFDTTDKRRLLLTSLTLTDVQRISCVTGLFIYKSFCENIYAAAGRKMPPELWELFTGGKES